MQDDDSKAEMSVADAGRLGGNINRDKQIKKDPDYFKKLGKLGGKKTSATHDAAYYAKIGARGGAANKEEHDTAHFTKIGKAGGTKTRDLIAKGKNDDTKK